jgi:threonine/homoserine/homoserine lactone efflux protein
MNFKYFFPPRTHQAVKIGYFISFTGSLPPGVVTMGVFQAGANGDVRAALAFSLGAILVESIFVWLTLVSTAWMSGKKKWFKVLEWVSFVVISLLVLGTGWSILYPNTAPNTSILLPLGITPFFAGMLVRLITPTLIPFWLGWNTTLFSRSILHPHVGQYRAYLAAISLGTLSAHGLFILLSNMAQGALKNLQTGANWIVFLTLLVVLILQIIKLSRSSLSTAV